MKVLKKLNSFKYIAVIFIVWIIFSWPYFLGKTPYPSDYQTNYFQPWVQYPIQKGPVKNNAQPDIIGQIYPWKEFTISQFREGQIPFWNPYSFAGTPHLANYQSAVFSPLNLLFFLPFKFITVWGFIVILQPLLAGLFTYLFSRSLTISEKGSLQASIAFMFCGFLVTWMGYATLGFAILPLPLALYSINKSFEKKKIRYSALLSLAIPLSFFSGHFQTSLYFLFTIILYCIYCSIFIDRKYIANLWFILFGILLSTPQLLPSIEFYFQSVRSEMFQKLEAIDLSYIPTLIAPDYYGNPVTRNDWFGHYAEWSGYAGVIGILLAGFSFFELKNKKVIFFIGLLLISILLAYDTPFLGSLVALKIPVLSTSAASRIIVLFSFSIAILSGFGFDFVSKNQKKNRRQVLQYLAIFLTISALALALPVINLEESQIQIAIKNSILPVLVLLLGVTGIVLHTFYKRIHLFCLFLLLFLSIFEMLRFVVKWQSFSKTESAYISLPITKFYNEQNNIDRFLGLSGAEDALYFRIPILTGYDPLYKAEYGEFIQYITDGTTDNLGRSVVGFPVAGKYTKEAIDFLGVKNILFKVTDENKSWAFPFSQYPKEQFTKVFDDEVHQVYRNNDAFERAFLVNQVIVSDKSNILPLMIKNDLSKIAVTEEKISLNGSGGIARFVDYKPNSVRINVHSNGENLLVLTDNYYPGWRAYVNGQLKSIHKVNYSFRGVVVPGGQSIVEFVYVPQSFILGTYIFLVGIMGIIIVGVLSKFKK